MKGINAMESSITPNGMIMSGFGSIGTADIDAASIGTR
jgi:hypothetical protein